MFCKIVFVLLYNIIEWLVMFNFFLFLLFDYLDNVVFYEKMVLGELYL